MQTLHNHNQTPISNERNGDSHVNFRNRTVSSASGTTTLASIVEGMNGVGTLSSGGEDEDGHHVGNGGAGDDSRRRSHTGDQDMRADNGRNGAARKVAPPGEKPPRSCDVCRQRKVKCVRSEDAEGNESSKCQGCHALDIECTYKHVARKPGRPNSFAKRTSASGDAGGERSAQNTGPVRGTGGTYQVSGVEEMGGAQRSIPFRGNSTGKNVASGSSQPTSTSARRTSHSVHPPPPGSSTFTQPQLPSPVDFGHSSWFPSPHKIFGQPGIYGSGLSPPFGTDGPTPTSNPGLKSLGMLDAVFDSPSSTGSTGAHGQAGGTPANALYGSGSYATQQVGPNGRDGTGSMQIAASDGRNTRGMDADHNYRNQPVFSGETDMATMPGNWASNERQDSFASTSAHGNVLAPLDSSAHHSVSFAGSHEVVPASRLHGQDQNQSSGNGGRSTFSVPSSANPSQRAPGGLTRGTGDSTSAASGQSGTPIAPLHNHHHPFKHIQVEDVTSWATISFFVSLYLRHFHCLVPLVHIPTFTNAIAMRQDREDVDFRAFLLSLVCYLISQSPKSRMIEHFTQSELERLQSRCHRASRLLQTRSYKVPSRLNIVTLMFDYFYSASAGKTAQTAAVLSEAIALAYVMGLHDDERTAQLGLDSIEVEMRKRTFWLLYAINVTEASAGCPIMIHEYEGVCTYPEEVDDDLITAAGLFRQPSFRTSLLVGFVVIMRLFRIHADCIIRHRKYVRVPGASGPDAIRESLDWIHHAQEGIQRILEGLPSALQGPERGNQMSPLDSVNAEVFGTERANILITAASVQFSLYDFKSVLNAGGDHGSDEQETVSRSMYNLLASIPLDHLAANGESMRGKVLRIIAALLSRSSTPGEELSSSVKDWYDMYSLIQFVQVIPRPLESRMPSREGSPSAKTGMTS